VAERIVVDLKDKVGLIAGDDATSFLSADSNSKDEATQALVALGYSLGDSQKALSEVDDKLETEERVKQALKRI
jgi:holliday junction DNA helicase RuvA